MKVQRRLRDDRQRLYGGPGQEEAIGKALSIAGTEIRCSLPARAMRTIR